ncbi:hypothetical protein P4204_16270 [Pseudomonas aeruginosa]|nr:hypothetical protein [Pseudomonas aeruginosa]
MAGGAALGALAFLGVVLSPPAPLLPGSAGAAA